MKRIAFLILLALCGAVTAANKYVAGSLYYYATQAGTSSDPYGGGCGFTKALNAASGGDTIFVKDTILTQRIRYWTYQNRVGTWAAGDTVANYTHVGATGIVYSITGDSIMYICETATGFAINDSIYNNAGATVHIKIAPTYPGCVIANAGTAGNPIYIIGTKSDWSIDRSVYAVLDGKSISLVFQTTSLQYFRFQNIRFINSSAHCFARTAGTVQYNSYYNCAWEGATNHGISGAANLSTLTHCNLSGNGAQGLSAASQTTLKFCTVHDNKTIGVSTSGILRIQDCAFWKNDSVCITLGTDDLIDRVTIDSCRIGIQANTTGVLNCLISNTRISRASKYPIALNSGCIFTIGDNNSFIRCGNSNAVYLNTGVALYSSAPVTSTGGLGYVDSANGVFNLRSNALGRRTAIQIGTYK